MKNKTVNFININTQNNLIVDGENLVDELSGEVIAHIVDDIPRFVS